MLKFGNTYLKFQNNYLSKFHKEPYPFEEVQIGNQIWMAHNLDINDGGSGIRVKNDLVVNGVTMPTQYYYTYPAAIRISESVYGWHLPTNDEWNTLISYIGGNNKGYDLQSTSGWNVANGTNLYGFNAIGAGCYTLGQTSTGSVDTFMNGGQDAFFRTSSMSNRYLDSTYFKVLFYNSPKINTISSNNDAYFSKFSVRLIKDEDF